MSSIHYKFKSSSEYSTVTFDGPSISLNELREMIMSQKKIAKSADHTLEITNAQSKEVYTDENSLIPRNSSVIVRRVPVQRLKAVTDMDPGFSKDEQELTEMAFAKLSKTADLANAQASEADKIMAMMKQSTEDYDASQYSRNSFAPSNYVCFRCGQKGHFIRQCPTIGDPRYNREKAPNLRMAGIPRDLLAMRIKQEEDHIKNLRAQHGGSRLDRFAPAVGSELVDHSRIPLELQCPMCKKLFTDCVVTPCCGMSYCDECVRNHLIEHDLVCPFCQETTSPDNLIANKSVRTAVDNFRNQKTALTSTAMSISETSSTAVTVSASMAAISRTASVPSMAALADAKGFPTIASHAQPIIHYVQPSFATGLVRPVVTPGVLTAPLSTSQTALASASLAAVGHAVPVSGRNTPVLMPSFQSASNLAKVEAVAGDALVATLQVGGRDSADNSSPHVAVAVASSVLRDPSDGVATPPPSALSVQVLSVPEVMRSPMKGSPKPFAAASPEGTPERFITSGVNDHEVVVPSSKIAADFLSETSDFGAVEAGSSAGSGAPHLIQSSALAVDATLPIPAPTALQFKAGPAAGLVGMPTTAIPIANPEAMSHAIGGMPGIQPMVQHGLAQSHHVLGQALPPNPVLVGQPSAQVLAPPQASQQFLHQAAPPQIMAQQPPGQYIFGQQPFLTSQQQGTLIRGGLPPGFTLPPGTHIIKRLVPVPVGPAMTGLHGQTTGLPPGHPLSLQPHAAENMLIGHGAPIGGPPSLDIPQFHHRALDKDSPMPMSKEEFYIWQRTVKEQRAEGRRRRRRSRSRSRSRSRERHRSGRRARSPSADKRKSSGRDRPKDRGRHGDRDRSQDSKDSKDGSRSKSKSDAKKPKHRSDKERQLPEHIKRELDEFEFDDELDFDEELKRLNTKDEKPSRRNKVQQQEFNGSDDELGPAKSDLPSPLSVVNRVERSPPHSFTPSPEAVAPNLKSSHRSSRRVGSKLEPISSQLVVRDKRSKVEKAGKNSVKPLGTLSWSGSADSLADAQVDWRDSSCSDEEAKTALQKTAPKSAVVVGAPKLKTLKPEKVRDVESQVVKAKRKRVVVIKDVTPKQSSSQQLESAGKPLVDVADKLVTPVDHPQVVEQVVTAGSGTSAPTAACKRVGLASDDDWTEKSQDEECAALKALPSKESESLNADAANRDSFEEGRNSEHSVATTEVVVAGSMNGEVSRTGADGGDAAMGLLSGKVSAGDHGANDCASENGVLVVKRATPSSEGIAVVAQGQAASSEIGASARPIDSSKPGPGEPLQKRQAHKRPCDSDDKVTNVNSASDALPGKKIKSESVARAADSRNSSSERVLSSEANSKRSELGNPKSSVRSRKLGNEEGHRSSATARAKSSGSIASRGSSSEKAIGQEKLRQVQSINRNAKLERQPETVSGNVNVTPTVKPARSVKSEISKSDVVKQSFSAKASTQVTSPEDELLVEFGKSGKSTENSMSKIKSSRAQVTRSSDTSRRLGQGSPTKLNRVVSDDATSKISAKVSSKDQSEKSRKAQLHSASRDKLIRKPDQELYKRGDAKLKSISEMSKKRLQEGSGEAIVKAVLPSDLKESEPGKSDVLKSKVTSITKIIKSPEKSVAAKIRVPSVKESEVRNSTAQMSDIRRVVKVKDGRERSRSSERDALADRRRRRDEKSDRHVDVDGADQRQAKTADDRRRQEAGRQRERRRGERITDERRSEVDPRHGKLTGEGGYVLHARLDGVRKDAKRPSSLKVDQVVHRDQLPQRVSHLPERRHLAKAGGREVANHEHDEYYPRPDESEMHREPDAPVVVKPLLDDRERKSAVRKVTVSSADEPKPKVRKVSVSRSSYVIQIDDSAHEESPVEESPERELDEAVRKRKDVGDQKDKRKKKRVVSPDGDAGGGEEDVEFAGEVEDSDDKKKKKKKKHKHKHKKNKRKHKKKHKKKRTQQPGSESDREPDEDADVVKVDVEAGKEDDAEEEDSDGHSVDVGEAQKKVRRPSDDSRSPSIESAAKLVSDGTHGMKAASDELVSPALSNVTPPPPSQTEKPKLRKVPVSAQRDLESKSSRRELLKSHGDDDDLELDYNDDIDGMGDGFDFADDEQANKNESDVVETPGELLVNDFEEGEILEEDVTDSSVQGHEFLVSNVLRASTTSSKVSNDSSVGGLSTSRKAANVKSETSNVVSTKAARRHAEVTYSSDECDPFGSSIKESSVGTIASR